MILKNFKFIKLFDISNILFKKNEYFVLQKHWYIEHIFIFMSMSLAGYTTLMKGVAGVPGDMYQIWTSPATMNTNNPQAMYLTNTFKGHYKTDLSQWNSMCLDRVTFYSH